MYQHTEQFDYSGLTIKDASKALIMLHGRGASAQSILSLASYLPLDDFAIIAPQASRQSWYPYSFMAPDDSNQPALNSAITLLDNLVEQLTTAGIPKERIYFLGFSQGACLSLEYTALNPAKWGGVVAFTGGLIGEHFHPEKYLGDFERTPFLITTGNPDPHVPLNRVEESFEQLNNLNAEVKLKVYPGRPHTITHEELELAKQYIFQ